MRKKIKVRMQNNTWRLSRERVAVHGGEDQLVWDCDDETVRIVFGTTSPFAPNAVIDIGRHIQVLSTDTPKVHEYYVEDSEGTHHSQGAIFVAPAVSGQPLKAKPETVTIRIGRTVFPYTCHVRRMIDEVVWVSPEDSTARIKFENTPFHKREFDAYELTGQTAALVGSYKYTVYVDDMEIDPVIIIDPPP